MTSKPKAEPTEFLTHQCLCKSSTIIAANVLKGVAISLDHLFGCVSNDIARIPPAIYGSLKL